jgi:hypothetical protein
MNTFLNFLMIIMIGIEYFGALHLTLSFWNVFLQIFRCSAPFLIIFKMRFYKYSGALHLTLSFWNLFLQILRCAAPYIVFLKCVSTNITVLCTLRCLFEMCFYKYFGALHLTLSFWNSFLQIPACRQAGFAALPLQIFQCASAYSLKRNCGYERCRAPEYL